MTLIEILVVLVLIGVVLGIVGGNFIGKGEKAKADAAKIEISQIAQTLDLYKLEIGRYPTDAGRPAGADQRAGRRDELERSVLEAARRCRRIRGATSTSTFRRRRTRPYEIISLGADGKEGGDGPNKDLVEPSAMMHFAAIGRDAGRAAQCELRRDVARASDRACRSWRSSPRSSFRCSAARACRPAN